MGRRRVPGLLTYRQIAAIGRRIPSVSIRRRPRDFVEEQTDLLLEEDFQDIDEFVPPPRARRRGPSGRSR